MAPSIEFSITQRPFPVATAIPRSISQNVWQFGERTCQKSIDLLHDQLHPRDIQDEPSSSNTTRGQRCCNVLWLHILLHALASKSKLPNVTQNANAREEPGTCCNDAVYRQVFRTDCMQLDNNVAYVRQFEKRKMAQKL